MIPNGKSSHYNAVKKLPVLSKGITQKHDSNFYFWNCLHSFGKEKKLESHKTVCKNKDFLTL